MSAIIQSIATGLLLGFDIFIVAYNVVLVWRYFG
jgi:hypothetical protein